MGWGVGSDELDFADGGGGKQGDVLLSGRGEIINCFLKVQSR
jgi:hypothetical protein